MLEKFINYIKKENLLNLSDRVLLAVSGGVDSIVLSELFKKGGYVFDIAHCNFQLRGVESDKDEQFVRNLAKKYNVNFFYERFETKPYSLKNKLSIQEAARNLRYTWLEKIRKENTLKYIATAHHKNDCAETILLNFIRGTGISGLHGIKPKRETIIRPLLFTSKNEIEYFARKHKLKYREDKSNSSDKYIRNKIRNHIIPLMEEINPKVVSTIFKNSVRIQKAEELLTLQIEMMIKKISQKKKDEIWIHIKEIKKINHSEYFLYEYLKNFGFNSSTINDIHASLSKQSGKQFFSETHHIIKDRDFLILSERKKQVIPKIIPPKDSSLKGSFFVIKFSKKTSKNLKINKSSNMAFLDFDKLVFPLTIRTWQPGDRFHPLGMKKQKKVSDFLIDEKIPIHQKNKQLVMLSENKIIWLVGRRISELYKINKTTKVASIMNYKESLKKNS